MANWLKQSTSVDVPIGPFLDETDGKTAETALTITQPDIRLKKNGGNWAQKNASQTLSHEESGWYELTLDATDTNTLGLLMVAIHESGALPVWREFMVVPAEVYDSLVSGSGNGPRVDVRAIEGADPTDTLATQAQTGAAAALTAYDPPTHAELTSALAAADDAVLAAIAALNNLSAAQVNAEVDTALSDYDGPTYTELLNLFRLTLRKDAGLATDLASLLTTINANLGNGDGAFANTTEALEALRDRGDAAWITATGFSTLDAAGVRTAVGLASANLDTQLDALPTNGELTTALAAADDAVLAAISALNNLSQAQAQTAAAAALAAYDPPTRTEATSDKDEILAQTAAILDDTGTAGVVVAAGSKAGYSLAADQSAVTMGTVNDLGATARGRVNAEVVDALAVDTYVEPTGPPPATASLKDKIGWMQVLHRNKRWQDNNEEIVYADDGTTEIATSTKTSTGTEEAGTFTRGEYT